MYVPKQFTADAVRALALIDREPFGTLVSMVDGKPFATHAPFVVVQREPQVVLGMHVARANPQWETIDGQDVLAIFAGPHAMISAGWYERPQRSVPTWNYSAVHCTGRARLAEAEQTRAILERLVARFEPSWRIEDADPEYIAAMEGAIAGVLVAIDRVEAKFKHSQNRTATDRGRVVAALEISARAMDRELAAEMKAGLG